MLIAELIPTLEDVQHAIDLCDVGRYLDAYSELSQIGPVADLRGPIGRSIAARLASHLGGRRRSAAWILRAHREHPTSGRVWAMALPVMLTTRGPIHALEILADPPEAESDDVMSDMLAARAQVLGAMRDFGAAQALLEQAKEIAPEDPWVDSSLGLIAEAADDLGRAEQIFRRTLERAPTHTPAVLRLAELLRNTGRTEECLTLLNDAAEKIQSPWLHLYAARALVTMERWAEAERAVDAAEPLMVLRDRESTDGLAWLRSDLAAAMGDIQAAIAHAESASPGSRMHLLESMRAAQPTDRRVLIDTPFIRQHHNMCAPATLAIIAARWARPVDHLEVAERICYDGTPAASERRWAADNGWVSAEFTVTWAAARALIERDIPFTLTVTMPSFGHLQAVVGLDERRGTLLIRDPNCPEILELHRNYLSLFASTGPRGHALVPPEHASKLEGIDLPDRALYDTFFQLNSCLMERDRAGAVEALADLRDADENHRLTHIGRYSIAGYDGDHRRALAAIEGLEALFPDDPLVKSLKAERLRVLGRRRELREVLEHEVRRVPHRGMPTEYAVARPGALCHLAELLIDDAREHDRARHLLQHASTIGAPPARVMLALAHLAFLHADQPSELRWLHYAVCLDNYDEQLVRRYFLSARLAGQADDALAMLRERFNRLGDKSGHPALSLIEALNYSGDAAGATAILEEAIARRPDDAELLLTAARHALEHGRTDRAIQLAEQATERAGQTAAIAGVQGEIALRRGDPSEARRWFGLAVQRAPCDLAAHARYAEVLAEIDGPPAAIAYLDQLAARNPHSAEFASLLTDWLDLDQSDAGLAAAERVAEADPDSVWAWRQIAIHHTHRRRFDLADDALARAIRLGPDDPATLACLGFVLAAEGLLDDAIGARKRSLFIEPGNAGVLAALVLTRGDRASRTELLRWAWEPIVSYAVIDDSVRVWCHLAASTLEPDEIGRKLDALCATRGDLPSARLARVDNDLRVGDLDRARRRATEATERFPLLPEVWLGLARVEQLAGDDGKAHAAASRALEAGPYDYAVLDWFARRDASAGTDEAAGPIEHALSANPGSVPIRTLLARLLAERNQLDRASDEIEAALARDPSDEGAWSVAESIDRQLARGPDASTTFLEQLIERLLAQRPASIALRVRRAMTLPDERADEKLEVAADVVRQAPGFVPAHLLRAQAQFSQGRVNEAIADLESAETEHAFGGRIPADLRRQAAALAWFAGDAEGACNRLRALLEEEPRDQRARATLSDMLTDLGRIEEAREHALKMRELAADDAGAMVYAASLLADSDPNAAIELFERAALLEPGYEFALASAATLHLAAHRADRALSLLRRRLDVSDHGPLLAVAAQAAWARNASEVFSRAIARLVTLEDGDDHMNTVLSTLDDSAHARVGEILDRAIDRDEVRPWAGYVWAKIRCWKPGFKETQRILHQRTKRAPRPTELNSAIATGYLDALAAARNRGLALQATRWYRAAIVPFADAWIATGVRYAMMGTRSRGVRWMSGWEHRTDLDANGFLRVAETFTLLRHPAGTRVALERAVGAPHAPPQITAIAAMWLDLVRAAKGEPHTLGATFGAVQPALLGATALELYRCVELALAPRKPIEDVPPRDAILHRIRKGAHPEFHCPASRSFAKLALKVARRRDRRRP